MDALSSPLSGAVSMPVKFYYLVLHGMGNGMALNFYWEIIGYVRFPYLVNREEKEAARYTGTEIGRAHV